MKLNRLSVAGALLALLAGCRSSPTESDSISDAGGLPSQIVHVVDAYAGGSYRKDSLVVDSASARWRLYVCGPISAVGPVCNAANTQVDSGTVVPGIAGALFERTRRADFRALRRQYTRTGVTPPDLMASTLIVVQNGKRQTISWESAVTVPEPISAVLCRLEQARGGFVNCAD